MLFWTSPSLASPRVRQFTRFGASLLHCWLRVMNSWIVLVITLLFLVIFISFLVIKMGVASGNLLLFLGGSGCISVNPSDGLAAIAPAPKTNITSTPQTFSISQTPPPLLRFAPSMASELTFRPSAPPPRRPHPTAPLNPTLPPNHTTPPRRISAHNLLFVLIGMAIATLFFSLFTPSSRSISSSELSVNPVAMGGDRRSHHRAVFEAREFVGGKIPLGLRRKRLRVVVTGGAGFVGSHLVDRLMARGDSVIVVDNFFTGRKENVMHHFGNPNFELIRHDVVEPLLLEVDQIYHLACPASPVHYKFNPVKTIKTNVVGTLNMLGLAKRIGARFLLTSTSEVYGDPLQHPQVETYWGNVNPIGVRSCYDEGKRTAETLTMDYHRGAQVEVRIARIFNTYGPRMCIDDGRVVSNFVAQALRKEPLTVYGDGKQTRSFQYVSDLVEGLMRLMEGEHVGPFNLGNPGEFTMLELAQVVQETIDPNARIEFRPNTEDDPHKRKPDITRAKEMLGWEPKVPLRQGLPLMVSDFRKRIFGDHHIPGATS